uniref:IGv domain-containing protein n=1 Tax=Rhodnius prolixus TaxID=13249 RepID=T1IFS5_RHOPR
MKAINRERLIFPADIVFNSMEFPCEGNMLFCFFGNVGWLRAEDQTVLTLDKRVVTHNSRISVSQDPDRDMWRLHIRQIKYSDRGCYMCQINTTNMKKQVGCIDVQENNELPPPVHSLEVMIFHHIGECICVSQSRLVWKLKEFRLAFCDFGLEMKRKYIPKNKYNL